jgi:hypothetical protein
MNMSHNCLQKDLEICVIELQTKSSKLIILSLQEILINLKNLDDTLGHLYKTKAEFLMFGDINTDYLKETNRKKQIASLLTTYNLSHTVNFATRIQNNSSTEVLPLKIYLWVKVN